jgi:hypothetical protein
LVFPVSLLFLRSPTVARTDLVRFFSSAPIVSRVARLCNMGVRFGLRFWLSVYASSLLLWVWTVVSRASRNLATSIRSTGPANRSAPKQRVSPRLDTLFVRYSALLSLDFFSVPFSTSSTRPVGFLVPRSGLPPSTLLFGPLL